ncbi:hypothetical protein B0H19DRAFT_1065981 [Mycena capillaripes]|nr:hypothetical protein B0H19DRAFT_1065981 [Mycena capillaripes]
MITHSRAFLFALAALATIQISTSSPLSHRGPSKRATSIPVKVLYKSNARSGMFCSDDEKKAIEQAIKDLKSIAAVAETVLLVDDAPQMEGVKTYLGTVTRAELSNLVKLRYTNVRQSYPDGPLTTVNAMSTTDYETLFLYCPKGPADLKSTECTDAKGDQNSFAVDVNADPAKHIVNSISFCPRFFKGVSLAAQTSSYQKAAKAHKSNSFDAPTTPAVTLLHESQHALVVLKSTNDKDIAEDVDIGNGISAVTPAQCAALTPAQKLENAENFAL